MNCKQPRHVAAACRHMHEYSLFNYVYQLIKALSFNEPREKWMETGKKAVNEEELELFFSIFFDISPS